MSFYSLQGVRRQVRHGALQRWINIYSPSASIGFRGFHNDGRQRLSSLWMRSAREANADAANDDAHSLMIKTGFLHQAYSGVFHLLPLGLRVQEKIEGLLDRHMRGLGASKVSLSSITNAALWRKTGRFSGDTSEFTKLSTRAGDDYFLSPTHEEEITNIIASTIKSSKWLPIRLYQITRKYRDERRPRQGLLRTREFVMKDLYTFDVDDTRALQTYHQVKDAYKALFDSLSIPYLVAEADSGSIGGNYSHEFQFVTDIGEDSVISCTNCDYVANEELAEHGSSSSKETRQQTSCYYALADSGHTLVQVFIPHSARLLASPEPGRVNLHVLKRIVPSLLSGSGDAIEALRNPIDRNVAPPRDLTLLRVFEASLDPSLITPPHIPMDLSSRFVNIAAISNDTVDTAAQQRDLANLRAIEPDDVCPRCRDETLQVQRAVELGHTFHLGTRYSAPLGATVADSGGEQVPLAMGCHGIGVSRIIGAVAAMLKDARGLNWPRVIAPWEVVLVAGKKATSSDVEKVYDLLSGSWHAEQDPAPTTPRNPKSTGLDTVIDDRSDSSLVQKLHDADLLGFPVIVVLGSRWAREGLVEVQCRRRLGTEKQYVDLTELRGCVERLFHGL